MFKWACFTGIAVVLAFGSWMLNDVRLEVRHSIQMFQTLGNTLNEQLPTIVQKSQVTTELLADNLPVIVQKTRATVDTISQVASDFRTIRAAFFTRDASLKTYADSVLNTLEASQGKIGLKKLLSSKGLQNPVAAKEWVAGTRLEVSILTLSAKSRKELVTSMSKNILGLQWYLELEGKEPVPLLDWLKANHPETAKALSQE